MTARGEGVTGIFKWGAALAVALCGLAAAASAGERVVRVYNWDQYIAADTLERFTAETGIRVDYTIFPDNETLDAVLMGEKAGYDVVFPSASPFFASQARIGLYRALDYAKIPNAAGVDKMVLTNLGLVDRGNRHALPYMIAATGFAYDAERVRALYPDAPVNSWRMLLDPAVVSRLSPCGVALLDTPTEAIPAALTYLGRAPQAQSPDSLADSMDLLWKIRPHLREVSANSYTKALVDGELCVAQGYMGDLVQARTLAAKAKNPRNIEVVIPVEGAMVNVDVMAVPANAPHPDEAMEFINFLLRPDIIAAITNETGYANAVPASLEFVDPEIRSDPVIFPIDAQKSKLFTAPPPGNRDYNRARNRAWAKFRAGQKPSVGW